MSGIGGAEEMIQPQRIINCHTAGLLPRGMYALECSIYPSGIYNTPGCGTLFGVTIGLLNRLNLGLSYGGDGIIGRASPTFNPHIGALIKYRIFEETYLIPAFAVGYDHQGFSGIDQSYNGYVFKSPGFFMAASKNYLILTKVQLGLHGGINYSLEESDKVQWPNLYVGTDMGINEELSVAVEYDFALNARDPGIDTANYDNPFRGFFNAGVRWSFSHSLYIEFDIKDMLQNKVTPPTYDAPKGERYGWDRELKIGYLQHF
jgi:hypothetical protein